MSRSALFRLSLSALVAVSAAAACSSPAHGRSASPDPPGVQVPVPATRTTVEFGPDAVLVAEIVSIGDDARATVRTPAGLFGEEILLADDHYVRMPHAAAVLGGDRWVHTDLSDPRQRHHLEHNPAGFIDLAGLGDLRVGDEVAGNEVLAAREPRPGVTVFELRGHGTIEVATETIRDPEPITAPEKPEVVHLGDLASR